MILKTLRTRQRVVFDPLNREHREMFYKFFKEMKWGPGGCPFYLEDKFTCIPEMCVAKLMSFFEDVDTKSISLQ